MFPFLAGAVAVLGPGLHSYSSQGSEVDAPLKTTVAQHMLISRQKLLPGSGCLSVRVTLDGPIRVLEIVDIQNRVSYCTVLLLMEMTYC